MARRKRLNTVTRTHARTHAIRQVLPLRRTNKIISWEERNQRYANRTYLPIEFTVKQPRATRDTTGCIFQTCQPYTICKQRKSHQWYFNRNYDLTVSVQHEQRAARGTDRPQVNLNHDGAMPEILKGERPERKQRYINRHHVPGMSAVTSPRATGRQASSGLLTT